jgi:hypothetical protein
MGMAVNTVTVGSMVPRRPARRWGLCAYMNSGSWKTRLFEPISGLTRPIMPEYAMDL